MTKFDKYKKIGEQGCPPYGAHYAQELANVIYEKTGKEITVYGSSGRYYYYIPMLNYSQYGMEAFKPNISKDK